MKRTIIRRVEVYFVMLKAYLNRILVRRVCVATRQKVQTDIRISGISFKWKPYLLFHLLYNVASIHIIPEEGIYFHLCRTFCVYPFARRISFIYAVSWLRQQLFRPISERSRFEYCPGHRLSWTGLCLYMVPPRNFRVQCLTQGHARLLPYPF